MTTRFETIKTVHPRKNFDLWVVKLTVRIPKNEFMDLYQQARTLRGWYSSYNRDGAIPGFQFKSETAAQQFTASNGGSKPATQQHSNTTNYKLATKWANLANSYLKQSKKKFDELEHTQSNTPKRMRQYNSKQVDAQTMFDCGTIATKISEHIVEGTLPKALEILQPVKSKRHLEHFVPGHASNGYYDAHRADKPYWLENNNAPKIDGINTHKQAIEIYNILQSYLKPNPEIERKIRIKALEDKVRFAKIDGFFPTPPELIKQMLATLNVQHGDIILEPSAGMGSIAEQVREKYPNNTLFTVEVNNTLAQLLEAKGFNKTINTDFLNESFAADRIIMNPPFEKRADVAHVKHAYDQLNLGGRIVAIMSAGPFHGTQKRDTEFQQWLYDVGADYHKNNPDAFKSAFRATGVQTYTVIINK